MRNIITISLILLCLMADAHVSRREVREAKRKFKTSKRDYDGQACYSSVFGTPSRDMVIMDSLYWRGLKIIRWQQKTKIFRQ